MRDTSTGILNGFQNKRALRHWERMAELAKTAAPENLRALHAQSQALGQRVATVGRIAESRLVGPVEGAKAMKLPPSTDWVYRPDFWAGSVSPGGFAPARPQTKVSDEVEMFHDCKSSGLSFRQVRNLRPNGVAAYSLSLDVFDFDGSFLSLVVKTPASALKDLSKRHILRLSLKSESERALDVSARLNLKHGPNTEQVSKEIALAPDGAIAEYDLAYVPFNETRVEQIWFDLFFENPMMNQISVFDLVLSRHLRAEL